MVGEQQELIEGAEGPSDEATTAKPVVQLIPDKELAVRLR
jgi:hypothetical protein